MPYDVVLTDGTTTYQLQLYQDPEDSSMLWQEGELPFLLPRQGEGAAVYANRDPETEIVEVWENWSLGFGAPFNIPGFYERSDGIDARFAGYLAPSPKIDTKVWHLVRNGDAEDSGVAPWTAGATTTITRDTSVKRTGAASWKLVNGNGAAGEFSSQALANPTTYQSRSVTIVAYVRTLDGTGTDINLRITDSVGTTNSSATSSATFTRLTATRAIDAGATSVSVGIFMGTSQTGYIDDFYIYVGDSIVRGATEFEDGFYIAVGQGVAKWDGTDKFDYVLMTAATCTNVEAHDGNIYAGFGTTAAYQYSADGTTWTASTRTTVDGQATFFVSVGGTTNLTLWKALTANSLSSSSTGINGGTAWTNYTVGGEDRDITGLYGYLNGPVVGREDGIWVWDETNSDFDSVTPEFTKNPDADNFAKGLSWKGWLYLNTARQGLIRYNSDGNFTHYLQELGDLLAPSGLDDFGGRILSFANDGRFLYVLVETPQADSLTRTAHLITLEEAEGRFKPHTLHDITGGVVDFGFVFSDKLYLFGRNLDTGSTYRDFFQRMDLPTDTVIPFRAATPSLDTSGTLDFPKWTGNFPGETKVMLSWELFGENIDSNNYYTLSYKRAGESSFTSVGDFNSLTNGSQKLTAKVQIGTASNRASKEWQFRLTVTYDGSGVAPLCRKLVMKALVRYQDTQRMFRFVTDIDSVAMTDVNGALQYIDSRTVYEQLRTWEDTAIPLTLTSHMGDDYDVILRPVQLEKLWVMPDEKERMLISVVAKQVNT